MIAALSCRVSFPTWRTRLTSGTWEAASAVGSSNHPGCNAGPELYDGML